MITKNIDSKAWKKLMSYAIHNCDIVLLVKRYDQWQVRNSKIQTWLSSFVDINDIEIVSNILSLENFLEDDEILEVSKLPFNNFDVETKLIISSNSLENFCQNLYGNSEFKRNLLNLGIVGDINKIDLNIVSDIVKENLSWMYYQKKCNEFLKEYKYEKILEKDCFFDKIYMKETPLYGKIYKTIYGFKVDNKISELLLSSKNMYEWKWPKMLDDICFQKNGKIWLYTIANRHICEIFCENEEEYAYLKSLEIEFDGSFVESEPITIDDLANM